MTVTRRRITQPRAFGVGVGLTATRFGRDVVAKQLVDTFQLTGTVGTARMVEALTAGRWETTISGASTVTIDVHDPERLLIESDVLQASTVMELGGRGWRLQRISPQDDRVTLTFEPAVIVELRSRRGKRSTKPGAVTRAGFITALAQEVRAKVWTPGKPAPSGARQAPAAAPRPPEREPGFSRGANVRVKGKPATREQLSNIDDVLTATWALTARYPMEDRRKGLVGAVMAITQEATARNLKGGHLDSQGLFQQRPSSGYKTPRDIPLATRDFLFAFKGLGRDGFFTTMMKNRGRTLGWSISEAQRDYTWRRDGSSPQGRDYDRWAREADRTVTAWLGGVTPTDQPRVQLNQKGGYSRDAGESSWDAMTRLADEIQLRCFEQDGTIIVSDDASLMALAGDIIVTPDEAWLTGFGFDHDAGLKAAEARVTGTLDGTRVWHGRSADVQGYGAADGRWLISTVSMDLFDPVTELTLARPQPLLPEPKPEASDVSLRSTAKADVNWRSNTLRGAATGGVVGLRAAIVASANKLIAQRHYKYRQARPYPPSLWSPAAVNSLDCSSSSTLIYKDAGAPDPSGNGFNGSGNTWTMWAKGKQVTHPKPGDLGFYRGSAAPPGHVVVFLGNGMVCSMGTPGRPANRVEWDYRKDFYGWRNYLGDG